EDIEILGLDKTHSATFDYAIDAPPDATVFRLTLRAEGTTETDDLVATGSHDVVLIPLISVDKTGPGSVTPGDSVTYSVTITNNSIEQTFTVDPDGLHDDVLESTDYNISVTATDFAWPDADNILGPGQSATADLELPNVQGVVTPLVNTFTVTGTKGENEPIPPASDQHEIEVTCPIDFVAQVDVIPDGGFPILGNTLRWEIMLYNTTGVDLTGVQIYEEPLKWGGQVPDADITWPGGSGAIPPHGSVQLAAFEKPITNDYFSAHTETAFMTTTLRATFGEVAGVAECEEEISVPLFSPITVVKIPDTSIALTGDTVNYEFMLVNVSEDETYWVTLHDPLLSPDPIPMYYNGDSQPATESGHVSPGEIVTGPLRSYIVKASDPDKLINTATAQFPDPDDPETTFYTTGKAEVLTVAPLSLVKEASSDNASRGTRISYTYELTNNTEYRITNITLTDDQIKTLIPGDYLEPHGQAISLDPFDSKTFEVPYDIPVDAPHPLINTATANGTVHLPAGARDVSAEATLAVQLEEPDITIEKTIKDVETNEELPDDLPQTAQDGDGILEGEVGQRVKYCFTVTNNSDSPDSYVSDIVVEDEQLGAGVLQPLFLAEVAKLTPSRAPGMLFGQESVEFCYPPSGWLTLTREKGDPQTNTVTLRGVTPSGASTIPVYTEGSVTVDLIGTDLLITKSTSQPLAYIGQDVTYTLRIENRNQSREIIDIEVFDSFLGDVELDATGWDWSAAGGTPGTLNIGGYATFTYTYTIQPDDPDPLVNTTSATGTLAVENTPVDDATQSALAITPSQLLVRKYPSISRALPEQEVSYTIAITNVGQVPVYGLSATDTRMNSLPAPSLTELWPNKTAYITYPMPMPTESELANEPDLDPFVNTVTVTGTINDANGIPLDEPVIG